MAIHPLPDDGAFMGRAVALAERGWGRVHPNPMVGAVVVRDGEIVGEGWHAEYGGPHAEVAALAAAGDRARGATLYVTLEPCAHHGKTPPCTRAVLEAGVAEVVHGAADPHPGAGGGAAWLREAGVRVRGGVAKEEVRAQNAAFFHEVESGTAFVALKYGMSLDARIGDAPGRRTSVTGPEALAAAQRLRAGFDAIMVGIGTVMADDPLLTARGDVTPRVAPARVVVDSGARLPLDGRLVRTAGEAPVVVACSPEAPERRRAALEAAGVRVFVAPASPGGIHVSALLDLLREEGARSVLCEGGGRLGSALLAVDRVERLHLWVAPRLYGEAGPPAFPGELPVFLNEGWTFRGARTDGGDAYLLIDRTRRPR